jgi:hypothetical protein
MLQNTCDVPSVMGLGRSSDRSAWYVPRYHEDLITPYTSTNRAFFVGLLLTFLITRSLSPVTCLIVQLLLSTAPARLRTGGGTPWPLHSERGAAPPSTRRLHRMSRTIPPAGAWPSPSARFSWAGGWRGGSASQAQTRRHRARASASLRRSITACRCRRARIGSVMGVAGMGGWSGLGEAHAWVRCGSAAIARSRRGSWRPTSRTLAQVTLPHAAK